MKQQWPAFLVTRHSLKVRSGTAKHAPRRRVSVTTAKQEFPRVANLTRRRPLPKGH